MTSALDENKGSNLAFHGTPEHFFIFFVSFVSFCILLEVHLHVCIFPCTMMWLTIEVGVTHGACWAMRANCKNRQAPLQPLDEATILTMFSAVSFTYGALSQKVRTQSWYTCRKSHRYYIPSLVLHSKVISLSCRWCAYWGVKMSPAFPVIIIALFIVSVLLIATFKYLMTPAEW